jgi:hypothetical protein
MKDCKLPQSHKEDLFEPFTSLPSPMINMGKAKIGLTAAVLLFVIVFLIGLAIHRQASRQQPMSFFAITNSSLGVEITKGPDGRLFCQLFESGHSISELRPLSLEIPFRHYVVFFDKQVICVSNIVTISWLAEDGYDGDPYHVVIDTNARRLIAGSSAWPVGGK